MTGDRLHEGIGGIGAALTTEPEIIFGGALGPYSHFQSLVVHLAPLCHFLWHTRSVTDDDVDFLPGDGPTSGISVTLTAGTLQAIRERVGKRGVSAYLEKAAQRQIERDNLDELIADFDKMHGPADPEAVAAKRARLTGGASNAGAAA